MNPSLEQIKQLRIETGAGIMECRKALEAVELDYIRARAALLESAEKKAAKRSPREAVEGKIELYSHNHGRIGVMVEINTETEFAARSAAFQQLASEIALQITAAAPLYVSEADIPAEGLAAERQAAEERARRLGKPESEIARIVEAALESYKDSRVLLRQPYIRDESLTVAQRLTQAGGRIGEKIVIRRFVRWEICPDEVEQPR